VVSGTLSPSARETNGARWVSWDDLAAPEIAHDICVLGRQAIALVRGDKK